VGPLRRWKPHAALKKTFWALRSSAPAIRPRWKRCTSEASAQRQAELAAAAQGEQQAPAAGEAPKKPSAAEPLEEAGSEAAHKEEIARRLAALEQRLSAKG
jgi:hypothetical protein